MQLSVIIILTILAVKIDSSVKNDDNQDTLIAAAVIFRHGDRNPHMTYKNDPYRNKSYFPEGFGELVNKGKLRQYELGQWFRNRYYKTGFLPEYYNPKDIYVRSTDVDRTLMSAAAVLAGLYPPKGRQIWRSTLPWQPIPIHTLPENADAILAMNKNCAKYNVLLAELINSEVIQHFNRRYGRLYQYITENSGEQIIGVFDCVNFYAIIDAESLLGLKLPKWIASVYPNPLHTFMEYTITLATYTTDLARLKVGPFLSELTELFRKKSTNLINSPDDGIRNQKFRMYSAHDVTIVHILNAIGSYEYEMPPYGGTLIFELYSLTSRRRRRDADYYVSVLYKNQTSVRAVQLRGCGSVNCSLDDFVRILEPVTVDLEQWEVECNN